MSFHGFNGNVSGDPDKGLPAALNIILEQLIALRADVAALHVTTSMLASKHGVTPEQYLTWKNAAFQQEADRVAASVLALLRAELPPPPPQL